MPKKIDPELRVRAVRLVRDHAGEYQNRTAATVAVARQLGVSRESVRRRVAHAGVDTGDRPGVTSEELAEIRKLKAENERLREAGEILTAASIFFRGRTRPPKPLIVGFIDQMRAKGHVGESVLAVLGDQGVKVAAPTYRAWTQTGWPVAARTVTDAVVRGRHRRRPLRRHHRSSRRHSNDTGITES